MTNIAMFTQFKKFMQGKNYWKIIINYLTRNVQILGLVYSLSFLLKLE